MGIKIHTSKGLRPMSPKEITETSLAYADCFAKRGTEEWQAAYDENVANCHKLNHFLKEKRHGSR